MEIDRDISLLFVLYTIRHHLLVKNQFLENTGSTAFSSAILNWSQNILEDIIIRELDVRVTALSKPGLSVLRRQSSIR